MAKNSNKNIQLTIHRFQAPRNAFAMLPLLGILELLQRQIKDLTYHPFFGPWNPITVILEKQKKGKKGGVT